MDSTLHKGKVHGNFIKLKSSDIAGIDMPEAVIMKVDLRSFFLKNAKSLLFTIPNKAESLIGARLAGESLVWVAPSFEPSKRLGSVLYYQEW